MDQWKNCVKYFVHNNLENVVQQINQQDMKRRKKLNFNSVLKKRFGGGRSLIIKKTSMNNEMNIYSSGKR